MALTRVVVLLAVVTAFAAGLLIGRVARPVPQVVATQPSDKSGRGSWLAQQLNLTADQQSQMKQIWSDVSRRGQGGPGNSRRGQHRRERDDAIKALIPADQLPAYERIHAAYDARNAADEKESKQQFERAVERTKALLTPEQRTKYETIMDRQGWGGRDKDKDRGRPSTRPT